MISRQLIFATRNAGKVAELKLLLSDVPIDIISVADYSRPLPDVVEDGKTFVENAIKKAACVAEQTGLLALADDSGLEVDALDGAPGVLSARFAGPGATDAANNRKLLERLEGVASPRTARFRCALVLVDPAGGTNHPIVTEGCCEGHILDEGRGCDGFGYDPLFYLPELDATFAEVGSEVKSQRSHRAIAMKAMKPRLIAHLQLAN